MQLHILDWIVIAAYFGFMGLIGYICSRKNTSTEEYFVGGRSFMGWVIGLSLVGTSISSISFMALPADTFKTSWIRYLPNFTLPIAVFIASKFFLPFFRQKKRTSAYELLEERFGISVRVYGTISFIITQIIRVSLVLYLTSLIIHEVTGLSPNVCILVAGGAVAVYTIVGGIDAVIWTDVLQTVVLAIGGVICLIMITAKLPGGLVEIFRVGFEHNKFTFAELIDDRLNPLPLLSGIKEKSVILIVLAGLTGWLTEYSANQNTIQRYCAAKSEKAARNAMWVCVWSSLPIWAFFMFIGIALYVFFQAFPAPEAQAMLSGEQKAEGILPFFVVNYLPPGFGGIVIAAALAAAMSSLDSSINAISTVTVVDIYKRLIVKDKTDKHYLHAAWTFASITAVLMITGALILTNVNTNTLQDTGIMLMSVVGGGMMSLYLLAFFTTVKGSKGIWVGILMTVIFTLWSILSSRGVLPSNLSYKYDLYYTGLIGNIIMFFAGYLGYALFSGIKNKFN